MTIEQQIVKLMSRKSGVTLGECVERGYNPNTARRILGPNMESKSAASAE